MLTGLTRHHIQPLASHAKDGTSHHVAWPLRGVRSHALSSSVLTGQRYGSKGIYGEHEAPSIWWLYMSMRARAADRGHDRVLFCVYDLLAVLNLCAGGKEELVRGQGFSGWAQRQIVWAGHSRVDRRPKQSQTS